MGFLRPSFVLTFLLGCGTSGGMEECLTSGDQYLVRYVEEEGDCGQWEPYSISIPEERGPRGGDYECDRLPYYEGCSLFIDMTCHFRVQSYPPIMVTSHYFGGMTFSGDFADGSLDMEVSSWSGFQCHSLYSISADRL